MGRKTPLCFAAIKLTLTTASVLALPNGQDTFMLDTNASDWAIGAELLQIQEEQEKVNCIRQFRLDPGTEKLLY